MDNFYVRELDPLLGQAVAKRTYLRANEDWGQLSERVALGNTLLHPSGEDDYINVRNGIASGRLLPAGRHYQHGDIDQPYRNMEVFSNCLHRDTKILTQEYGSIEIGKLVNKTAIIKCADGKWRSSLCSSHGIQKLYKYSFKKKTGPAPKHHCNSVIATRDHRWFLYGMKETNHLEIGQVLEPASSFDIAIDPEAICHGLIYGDGTGHKRRNDYGGNIVSQGRSYCSIRLCGDDKKYLNLFEDIHCTINYPKHSNGDPIVYVGNKPWKEFPTTNDPEYIAGFIHGWWLADGSKTYHNADTLDTLEISTSNEDALNWLKDNCAYAGYAMSGYSVHERKEDDGSYKNGKTLYSIRLFRTEISPFCLFDIEEYGEDEVFCFEEPITTGFVLANGILTGNCSTAPLSFLKFLLLLNGSGVGRNYSDDQMIVDWRNMPTLNCVLSMDHSDYNSKYQIDNGIKVSAKERFPNKYDYYHLIEDSREGWAKGLEILEVATYEKQSSKARFVFDFSDVRKSGTPIKGMQNRPASGPIPLIYAFQQTAKVKHLNIMSWEQNMIVDHYMSECVANGGARRSARIALKYWQDTEIFKFITIKKDNPWMWSSNNSIGVDAEFWSEAAIEGTHAYKVFMMATENSYGAGGGEPGFINLDKLTVVE